MKPYSCCAMQGVSNGLVTVWAMVAAPAICASAKLKDLVCQRICILLRVPLAATIAVTQCVDMAQKCESHRCLDIVTREVPHVTPCIWCRTVVLNTSVLCSWARPAM